MHLHSNMVLLQLDLFNEPEGCITNLHSNMVLLQFVRQLHFAFRNLIYIPIWFYFNGIRTPSLLLCLHIYIPIWFYFNNYGHSHNVYNHHLHSNMVLLQLIRRVVTQMVNRFTFQYGSTSIRNCIYGKIRKNIYIPIWFYFNRAWLMLTCRFFQIYIPIWFYFNGVIRTNE